MATTGITFKGDKILNRKLQKLSTNIKNARKPLEQSGKYVIKQSVKNFQTEGATLQSKWKPLSPFTMAQKSKLGFGAKKILQRTGKLMRSIKIIQLNKFLVKISSKNPYYKYHQSTAARKKLPRRKMLDITNEISKDIVKIFKKYILKDL